MTTNFIRSALAMALVAGTAAASAAPVDLKLTGWAIGGNTVQVTGHNVWAGGFTGSLANAGSFDSNPFLTYCIELSQNFSFSGSVMPGYEIVGGAAYFGTRHHDAAKAERLGQLWTYVASHPEAVNSAAESTAMQLAIWNIVYDDDNTLTHSVGADFSDKTSPASFRAHANNLLAQSLTVGASQYDVFALESASTQDFLLAAPRLPSTPNGGSAVPEPASLALAMLALVGAGAATRRRSDQTA